MFLRSELLQNMNPKELLDLPTEVFNNLFTKMELKNYPNIIIATIYSTLNISGHSIDEIEIIDNQGKYGFSTSITGKVFPTKHTMLEREEIIKDITIEIIKSKHSSTENYRYFKHIYYSDKFKKGISPQTYIHRIILLEFDEQLLEIHEDKRFFELVANSIDDWGWGKSSHQIDDFLINSGRKLLNNNILKNLIIPSEGNDFFSLFDIINTISLFKYEGAENKGKILFTNKDKLEQGILLEEGIELNNYRAVRKLLEISNGNLYLLCDGYKIVGFIEYNSSFNDGRSFVVNFKGLGRWELQQPLTSIVMSVEYGIPSMSKVEIREEDFSTKFNKVFPTANYKSVWSLINSAKEQQHGTMVVVVEDGYKEMNRLRKQLFPIKSLGKIDSTNIKDFTSIDGAILVDTKGICHAIGVIIDGIADSGVGDMSRGARYNSALKYINALKVKDSTEKCLIVIISEDGMINIKTEDDLV